MVPGLTDISIEVVLVMLHRFPLDSIFCNNTGVCGWVTISVLISDSRLKPTEVALGRKEYQ